MKRDYWQELAKHMRFVRFVMCGHLSVDDANTLKENITYVRVSHKNIMRYYPDYFTLRNHLRDCYGWLL